MRNEEFDIVRDLIAGRGPKMRETAYPGHALAPASFREIDGEVLARQYVAHRKFLETEAMAGTFSGVDRVPAHVRTTRLRGERRIATEPERRGWLSSLARLFGRR